MNQAALHEAEGYTLVELMVTLLLTLVLSGALISIYLAATQWVEPWRREITLEDHAHLIVQRLFDDLSFAEQLDRTEDGAWTLVFPSGRRVRYTYHDTTLARNGQRMHALAVPVTDFRLVPSRIETQYALRRRDTQQDDERSLIQVAVHLALQSPERMLTLTVAVAPRQHRPWHPIGETARPHP